MRDENVYREIPTGQTNMSYDEILGGREKEKFFHIKKVCPQAKDVDGNMFNNTKIEFENFEEVDNIKFLWSGWKQGAQLLACTLAQKYTETDNNLAFALEQSGFATPMQQMGTWDEQVNNYAEIIENHKKNNTLDKWNKKVETTLEQLYPENSDQEKWKSNKTWKLETASDNYKTLAETYVALCWDLASKRFASLLVDDKKRKYRFVCIILPPPENFRRLSTLEKIEIPIIREYVIEGKISVTFIQLTHDHEFKIFENNVWQESSKKLTIKKDNFVKTMEGYEQYLKTVPSSDEQ